MDAVLKVDKEVKRFQPFTIEIYVDTLQNANHLRAILSLPPGTSAIADKICLITTNELRKQGEESLVQDWGATNETR